MAELHPLAVTDENSSFGTKGNGAGKTSPEEQKGNDTQWPEPEKIEPGLSSIEAFPFEIMPEPLEAWVRDASYRMQSPPDFIAIAAINLIGAIIGTRCAVRPKQHDDWLVVPNLWGGVVGRPSTLKTPCLIEALKPLARLEIKEKEYFDEQFKSYEVDLIEHQSQKDSLKAEMKKAASGKGKKTMDAIKDELINLEEPDKPILKRYKTNDATIEKLSELLNENPGGLLLFRDELVGLLSSWDKPGRESDRAFFLESWNGVGSLTTDRIGRGTIFTKNLCLSVLGGIQPAKLTGYLLQSMNGLENDGLLQRLQLLVFPDEIYDWKLVDQAPDREARERSFRIIHRLTEMDFEEVGAIKDNDDDFPFMRFSEDAQQIFNDWITDLELNKLRADDHPMLIEHFGKYRSLMPSLALIFHLINIADGATGGPISVKAAEQAAAWCDYLESHARRVYGLVSNVDEQAAARLGEKIKAGKIVNNFTVRDVYRNNWHLLNTKELAQAACDELVDAGWIRPNQTLPSFGYKGKLEFEINPKILAEDS